MDGYHYDEKDREINDLKDTVMSQNELIQKLKNIVKLKDKYINRLLSHEDYYKNQVAVKDYEDECSD